jgi:ribosomal protein S18 acetylase RimI-like enzyme
MIEVKRGLKDEHRMKAAEIYTEAFYPKYARFVKDKTKVIRLIETDLVNGYAICAYHDGDLVGLAGIHHNNRTLVEFRYKTFLKVFGFPGIFAYPMLMLFYNRKPKQDELLMDGIAVSREMRGKGAGTKLLKTVFDFAVENGYKSVRLDVIDTNPRAKALYERMGFQTVKTRSYPFMMNISGFKKVFTMVKTIDH